MIFATRVIAAVLFCSGFIYAQEPAQMDEFSFRTQDALMARVDHFAEQLSNTESTGYIKLNGPKWTQYRFLRKIEGCNRWRKRPIDTFKFILGPYQDELKIEFWRVPKGQEGKNFVPTVLDYRMPQLPAPIELSASRNTDEYCPTSSDVEWFSKFMVANPLLKGKVVIDTSKTEFIKRVVNHRKALLDNGVNPTSVRFIRRKFIHERDEQWWLVPNLNRSRQIRAEMPRR